MMRCRGGDNDFVDILAFWRMVWWETEKDKNVLLLSEIVGDNWLLVSQKPNYIKFY